jgi:hypothetical protein
MTFHAQHLDKRDAGQCLGHRTQLRLSEATIMVRTDVRRSTGFQEGWGES